MAHDLPKAYEPGAIETRWAEYWIKEKLFSVPTPPPGETRPVFTLLLPPPNVTGQLHMGHMFGQTQMDIIVRWHRMRGFLTLWLPGTDHAGIATQMMVERQLATEGKKRRDMGREAFIERVWEWKRHYGGAILEQMKRLGASVDWDREYFTMDENLSRAVREVFVRLYEEGLIYRGKYIVTGARAAEPRFLISKSSTRRLLASSMRFAIRLLVRANSLRWPRRDRRRCWATQLSR